MMLFELSSSRSIFVGFKSKIKWVVSAVQQTADTRICHTGMNDSTLAVEEVKSKKKLPYDDFHSLYS